MREFKSTGIDFTFIGLWFFTFYIISDNFENFDILKENIYYVLFSLVVVLIFSFNVIKVSREGIIKELYILPIKIKSKTWREIKFFIEVDEIYNFGEDFDSPTKAIWFINENDKVCFRINKGLRGNLTEILKMVDKFEDKYEKKIKVYNPYLMKRGFTKVNDFEEIKEK